MAGVTLNYSEPISNQPECVVAQRHDNRETSQRSVSREANVLHVSREANELASPTPVSARTSRKQEV